MSNLIQARRCISSGVFGLSAAAWAFLILSPSIKGPETGDAVVGAMCINGVLTTQTESVALLHVFTITNLLGWAVMIVAMMFPTLISPLTHVAELSFRHKRLGLMSVFLLAYLFIWSMAGVVLMSVSLLLRQIFSAPYFELIISMLFIALVWQCSPLKQLCLNRNHQHPAMRAYGLASYQDAARFGFAHGVWCVGSCWALMLFSTVSVVAHQPVMLLLMLVMLSESMQVPRPPSWEWRLIPARKLRGLAMR